MTNQISGEKTYVIEKRYISLTHEEIYRDMATWRPMVAYLVSEALEEDEAGESCREYVIFRQPSDDCEALRVVRISSVSGGFKLELEEEGELIDSARFDDDNCDKVDLAIKILNVLDGED